MKHTCALCPHDLTVVHIWEDGDYKTVPIKSLSNSDLLHEYACEIDGSTRSIIYDPPSNECELKSEILRRMGSTEEKIDK
jgi:hypothetical protein